MNRIEQRLQELGIELPAINPPAANYEPYIQVGKLVFISGQTAKWNGEIQYRGRIGEQFTLEEGKAAARLCGLNILLQIKKACGGELDKVLRCVQLRVFVQCVDGFELHPKVADGASDLMLEVFQEAGRHVRVAAGNNSLPSGSAVEIEAIFEVNI